MPSTRRAVARGLQRVRAIAPAPAPPSASASASASAEAAKAAALLSAQGETIAALQARVATLEERLSSFDATYAPVLWQDVGRRPLPSLPPVLEHVRRAAGDDAGAQAAWLADKVAPGEIGTRAAAPLLRGLGGDGLHEHARADAAPLPTPEDRVRYGGDDHVAYWLSGLADGLFLSQIAERHGCPLGPGTAFLDFGCASGRVLRHVHRINAGVTAWGTDISVAPLTWAREQLSSDLRLVQSTMVPGLPIPDDALDVVFAGSVFTHVAEFEETLLADLVRITRPGGLLLLSIHPERAWDRLGAGEDDGLLGVLTHVPHRAAPLGTCPVTRETFATPMSADRVVVTNTTYPINNHYTFHQRRWIEQRWATLADLVEVVEHGHGRRQDLVVLRAR